VDPNVPTGDRRRCTCPPPPPELQSPADGERQREHERSGPPEDERARSDAGDEDERDRDQEREAGNQGADPGAAREERGSVADEQVVALRVPEHQQHHSGQHHLDHGVADETDREHQLVVDDHPGHERRHHDHQQPAQV